MRDLEYDLTKLMIGDQEALEDPGHMQISINKSAVMEKPRHPSICKLAVLCDNSTSQLWFISMPSSVVIEMFYVLRLVYRKSQSVLTEN